jgi:hypothetical protein
VLCNANTGRINRIEGFTMRIVSTEKGYTIKDDKGAVKLKDAMRNDLYLSSHAEVLAVCHANKIYERNDGILTELVIR